MPERGTLQRRDVLRIGAVAGVGAALGAGLVSELLRRGSLHRVSFTRTRLGTLVTVTVVHPDASAARAMVDEAFAESATLHLCGPEAAVESMLIRFRDLTSGRVEIVD